MNNKIALISLLTFASLSSFGNVSLSTPVFAEGESEVTSLIINDSDYKILVGEEVKLEQSNFTFSPSTASDKSIYYSYSGNDPLPAAMFTTESTFNDIIVKGMALGNFSFDIHANGGNNVYTTVTIQVVKSLESTTRNGITVIKSQEDNNVQPGTTSLYKSNSAEKNFDSTPLFIDGHFNSKAIFDFLSKIIKIEFFVILGIVVIGLLFLYVIFFLLKKAIIKRRR